MDFLKSIFGGNWEAQQRAAKYRKLAEKLEEKISEIEEDIMLTELALNLDHNALTSYPDSAEGLLISTFEDKEEIWKEKYTAVINNMNTGVEGLKSLKTVINNMAAQWEQAANMEE